jgi:hypothetical protein
MKALRGPAAAHELEKYCIFSAFLFRSRFTERSCCDRLPLRSGPFARNLTVAGFDFRSRHARYCSFVIHRAMARELACPREPTSIGKSSSVARGNRQHQENHSPRGHRERGR